jgi:hypothetical protein
MLLAYPAVAAAFGYVHGILWRLACRAMGGEPVLPICSVTDLWESTPLFGVLYYISALVPLAFVYSRIGRPEISRQRSAKLREEFAQYVGPGLTLAGVVFTALITGDAMWRRGGYADFFHLVGTSIVAGCALVYLFWGIAVRMCQVATDACGAIDRAVARVYTLSPLTLGLFLAFFASMFGDHFFFAESTQGAFVILISDLVILAFITVVELAMSFVLLPDTADAQP